ncbi:hypothetical protein LOTGIDRAFT_170471 [Lottia gigantea]|uniref:Zinc finger protein ush n=1 Tax=Lottia gigantea TaxID=225164 RepID=V3ZHZ8_LOTGI|nr:hypothetical protein LOTGIDRAFT_170471 [Lottia gigantea]ESO81930.1 hypothetical protein LOTGIDRAFT_170471 [Lottia gigantea]
MKESEVKLKDGSDLSSHEDEDEPKAKRIKIHQEDHAQNEEIQNGHHVKPSASALMSSSPNSMMEGLLSHLQLPSDVLHLKRIEVNVDNNLTYGWVVCSGIPLPKGSSLGPFQGEIISTDVKVKMGDLILQFNSIGGKQAYVNVSNQSGAWLTLLRQSTDSSCCNTQVHLDGGRIWCQVESDLDIGSELIASFTFHVEGEEELRNKSPESSVEEEATTAASPKVTQPVITQSSTKPTSASGHAALIYGCPFCGVRFSSPRTLQGHISFYCSRKPSASADQQDQESQSEDGHQSVKDEPITDDEGERETVKRPIDDDSNSSLESPEGKFSRPEQLSYQCTSCSYTTDKISSLNRHRRIHNRPAHRTPSPKPIPVATSSAETYCKECNIQFSSMNTFKAHKEFYCSQRCSRVKNLEVRTERLSGDSSPASVSPKLLSPNRMRNLSPRNHHLISPQSYKSNGSLHGESIMYTPVVDADGKPSMVPTVLLQPLLKIPPQPEVLSPKVKPAHQQETKRSDSPKCHPEEDQPLDLSTSKPPSSSSLPEQSPEPKRIKSERSSPCSSSKSSSSPKTPNHLLPGLAANPFLAQMMPNFFPFALNAAGIGGSALSVPGVSRCVECNIVFYKHENFLIHKQHYCSGKKVSQTSPVLPEAKPDSKSPEQVESKPSTSSDSEKRNNPISEIAYRFFCIPCKIKFSSASTLKAHKEFYCPHGKDCDLVPEIQSPPADIIIKPEMDSGAEDEEVDLRCSQCENKFRSLRLLKLHICSSDKHKVAFLRCAHCDYVTQTESRMADHMKVHVPTRSFRCTICGYRGNTIRGMRMHGKTHIDNGEEFTDDNMVEYREPPLVPIESNGHGIPSPLDMETELLRIKNEPYKRRRSRKSFEKSENMGLQVQQCSICGDTFANSNYLSIHMKSHSAMTSSRTKLQCDQCDFIGKSVKDLVCHQSVHDVTNDSGQENTDPNSSPSPISSPKQIIIKEEKLDRDYDVAEKRPPSVDIKPIIGQNHPNSRPASESPKSRSLVKSPHEAGVQIRNSVNGLPYLVIPNPNSLSPNLIPTPPIPLPPSSDKYCHSCDISFTYQASFIAHKKYYCTAKPVETHSSTATA